MPRSPTSANSVGVGDGQRFEHAVRRQFADPVVGADDDVGTLPRGGGEVELLARTSLGTSWTATVMPFSSPKTSAIPWTTAWRVSSDQMTRSASPRGGGVGAVVPSALVAAVVPSVPPVVPASVVVAAVSVGDSVASAGAVVASVGASVAPAALPSSSVASSSSSPQATRTSAAAASERHRLGAEGACAHDPPWCSSRDPGRTERCFGKLTARLHPLQGSWKKRTIAARAGSMARGRRTGWRERGDRQQGDERQTGGQRAHPRDRAPRRRGARGRSVRPPRRLDAGLIGLILPELDNPIFPALAQVIENRLAAAGYTCVFGCATHVVDEIEYLTTLSSAACPGSSWCPAATPTPSGTTRNITSSSSVASRWCSSTGSLPTYRRRSCRPTIGGPRRSPCTTWQGSGTAASASSAGRPGTSSSSGASTATAGRWRRRRRSGRRPRDADAVLGRGRSGRRRPPPRSRRDGGDRGQRSPRARQHHRRARARAATCPSAGRSSATTTRR